LIEAAQEEDQAQLVEDTQKENKRLEDEEPEPIPEESRESFDTSELDEFEPESALAAAEEASDAPNAEVEDADESSEPIPEKTTEEADEVVQEGKTAKGFRRPVRRKKQ